MPVKIRLQRRGRTKRPFYHIVVADGRAPRDGRFIEKIGSYNPMTKPATIELDRDRAFDWLMKGAQPTDTARAILRFKGVMYRKHLMRGVSKGALTTEQADAMYQKWIDEKESKIAARVQAAQEEIAAHRKKVAGVAKAVAKPVETATDEHKPQAEEQKSFADSVEQTTVESLTETAAPAAEEAAPEVKEEAAAPVVEETPAPIVEEAAPAESDDLKTIEGIGPKIAELLNKSGINTFAELAAATPESIKETLSKAEGNFGSHDPGTWPAQAKMAADGEWDKLKAWQDELDGGKVAAPKAEEE